MKTILIDLISSNNTNLNKLWCYSNQIEELDISKCGKLTVLDCRDNELDSLDLSQNTELNAVYCLRNNIGALDISSNKKITILDCSENQLSALDVTNNTELLSLYFNKNQITEIDVSQNTKLTGLYCQNNKLTALDVSNNTALERLSCGYNRLSSMDVSNINLNYFSCGNNEYSVSDCCLLDPASLPGQFDLSKAKNMTNCKLTDDGKILYLGGTSVIQYYYDCGLGESKLFNIAFPNPAHSCAKVDAKDATCEDEGNIEYWHCSKCGYDFTSSTPKGTEALVEDTVIPPTDHSYGSWKITTEPTLTSTGTAERVCENDSAHTETNELPALTDTTVWTKDDTQHIDPTEETEGKDVYTSDYGDVEVVLPVKPHNHVWDSWTIVDKPTLTEKGTAESICTKNSEHKETKELPALTDTTVWTKDDTQHVDPTEETEGKDVYTSDYGDVEVVLPVKPHNHVWDSWTIVDKPTLTEKGTAERICTKNSEHTETKELPALTDTTVWTKDDTQHVDPTEEAEGKDVYTSDYGDVEVVLPVKPHTHSLVKTEAQAATCTTSGNKAYWTCSGCNKMFSDENGTTEITAIPTIPAAGHTYSPAWSSNETHHWHASTCGHTDAVDGKEEHIFVDGKCKVCQRPDPNYETPTDTSVSESEPPETDPSDTESSDTQPPETDPSDTESSDTQPPVTDPSDTGSSDTQPPVTDPSDTEPSVTQPPDTEPPVTEPTATNPPYIPYYPPSGSPAPAVPASREPFLQDKNGKIGWAVISDDIWATSDGETVRVNMNGTTELPKNIVSDIAGRDIDLVLIMNRSFTWTINGTSVTKAKTVDMNVRKISKIPRSVVQDFFGDSKTIQLDLRHNGDFGFTAELTVDLGEKYSGLYANSYCYRARNFEFGDCAEIVNGQAKLRFTHASSWLITVEDFPAVEDVSSASAVHSEGTPIDMSNSASGVPFPEFDEKRGLRLSNRKRRYRVLKKRRLEDMVFVL